MTVTTTNGRECLTGTLLPAKLDRPSSGVAVVIDLPFLASEVNEAHRQVTFHAKGMLLEAKRAGDALLAAKAKVRHGEFKAWIAGNCRCSYRSAAVYMQVAKVGKSADLCTFEGSLAAFLEAHAKPRVSPPQATPSFTEKDADRVLNIAARVERGEGAEKVVAAKKLAEVAEAHGTTWEAIVERSKAMCPDRDKTPHQAEVDEKSDAIEEEIKATKAELRSIHEKIAAFQAREALILKLMDHTDDERLEMLADALLRIEELEAALRIA